MNFKVYTQKPFDQYWGLFVTPIAFFDENDKLIYYRKKHNAVQIYINGTENPPVYFTVSNNERYIYFRERGAEPSVFYHIILDTKDFKYKRITWQETENLPFGVLESFYFSESILNQFEMYSWEDTIKDNFKKRNWLGVAKWYSFKN
jgi:hypothetical protein